MSLLLLAFFVLPLLAFLGSLLFKNNDEKIISGIAVFTSGIQVLLAVVLFVYWLGTQCNSLSYHIVTVYKSPEFYFGLDLFYDKIVAVYLLVASVLIFIVSIFSKTYMHRESGFKRYFNHYLLFYFGMNVLLISGNFETMFLGWEIIGMTSFLLISFYRDRYLPVRNALKVLSFYRLGDAAFVCAMWFCHHLFHSNVLFTTLEHSPEVLDSFHIGNSHALFISVLFIFAAAVKSAQLPFCSWLPRAMEGPTVSSAIFYGSMSVHIGVFLLMRTYPIWENIPEIKIVIIACGLLTAIVSSFIASVQPTAKTQIAYSSITQIGIMFIEVALGWHWLALVHFACNAFLRTYQLLVSPSAMSYLVHQQIFKYDEHKKSMYHFLPKKMYNTLYMLSVKEWNLDTLWYRYLWIPFKKTGRAFHFLRNKAVELLFLLLIISGVLFYIVYPLSALDEHHYISYVYAAIALALILIAWTERRSAIRAWDYISMSQAFFMLSIVQQSTFELSQIIIYLSGIVIAFAAGNWCLLKVKRKENNVNLNEFHGHVYEHPTLAVIFLLSSLMMIGFPISPTFVGLDILFSEIELHNKPLLICSALIFIFLELATLRIYSRIFLGQHVKTYHETAFRSS